MVFVYLCKQTGAVRRARWSNYAFSQFFNFLPILIRKGEIRQKWWKRNEEYYSRDYWIKCWIELKRFSKIVELIYWNDSISLNLIEPINSMWGPELPIWKFNNFWKDLETRHCYWGGVMKRAACCRRRKRQPSTSTVDICQPNKKMFF